MSNRKISLVLEGGGYRGAFTAGCLSWLIENNIDFDASYAISTGALHLTSFLLKDKELLFKISTDYICDEKAVGFKAFLNDGHIVSYEYLLNLLRDKGLDITKLKDFDKESQIGLYDLSLGKTIFIDIQDMNMEMLKASCSLPILGRITKIDDHEYLDGGITKMIPIEKAIEDGNQKHLVIATKPIDYIRKPASKIVRLLMKIVYRKCPQIEKDYKVRHLNYQKQISLIKDLVETNDAIYMCPSKKTNVTRLGGTKEELEDLFKLGYSDMENNKEKILSLLK